jgi:His/Glu/Gln/Arg/opine family amino acid ABC transporter permease subunit
MIAVAAKDLQARCRRVTCVGIPNLYHVTTVGSLERSDKTLIHQFIPRFPSVLSLLAAILLGSFVHADTLDQIRQRGRLRWGGDEEGGGPYIYRDKANDLVGFEVEIMDEIGHRLGAKSEFVQGNWSDLTKTLDSRPDLVDVIANGFELTPENLTSARLATIPYYVYELQLISRKQDSPVSSWQSLADRAKKVRVGVLSQTAADVYAHKNFDESAEVVRYESTTDILREIENKKLDATIQDTPATVFLLPRYPSLAVVDVPVGRGFYVIYCRAGDERLRDAIDGALLGMTRDGSLRRICNRYGIWNSGQDWFDKQSSLVADSDKPEAPVATYTGWSAVRANIGIMLKAAGMTVFLTVTSMPLAMLAGLLIALGRLYGPGLLRPILSIYVEVIRGTPLLLQLTVIFFLLPGIHINLPAVAAAILGLAINYSAYEAEIYRAGLLAIPSGQMEAALALGMTRRQALRHVIVPQAVRLVIPPVTNDFIALFKDTAVCSVITVVELTKQYTLLASTPHAYLQFAAITAGLYMVMSYPLAVLTRRMERRSQRVNV